MSEYQQRFGGVARLYGHETLERFRRTHLAVIGIGGVGSWSAEALARGGIGQLTLVDLDQLCITNTNRQIHALDGQFGRPKVASMAERIRAINPDCTVHAHEEFFNERTAAGILGCGLHGVIDAIDVVRPKGLLLAACRDRAIPVVACGGAGGRRDASRIKVCDLSQTHNDALLNQLRRNLRSEFGFPDGTKSRSFGIPTVFSPEGTLFPQLDGNVGPSKPAELPAGIRCDAGYGTATHVTASFGLFAAGELLNLIAAG